MKITTINPATEEVLAEYDAIPVEQVKDEVQDSRMIFNSIWKKLWMASLFLRGTIF